jgi:hypothetical protein
MKAAVGRGLDQMQVQIRVWEFCRAQPAPRETLFESRPPP